MSTLHKTYEALSGPDRLIVDEAFNALYLKLRDHFIYGSASDSAEKLVEAIAVYLEESRRE